MPGEIFFRDESIVVSSAAVTIGDLQVPLESIVRVRAGRARGWRSWIVFPRSRYLLVLSTATGDIDALRHHSAFFIFQLVKAIEHALRRTRKEALRSDAA